MFKGYLKAVNLMSYWSWRTLKKEGIELSTDLF